MPIKKLIVIFIALLLAGCTRMIAELVNLPDQFSNNKAIKNIAYGDKPWQKLDVYLPEQASDKDMPVVVFFYGGRWTNGSKALYQFVGEAFAKHNYMVVIADYSKYPQVKFPAFVEDGAKAVAWTYKHIAGYGGSSEKLYLAGHSAGAHIGALLSADERYLQAEGIHRSIIKAFAGLAGPYDFVPKAKDLKAIFGPPENYPAMQVTTFIEGREPPMLLLWGDEDTAVLRRNIDLLARRISDKNGKVETVIYPGVGHMGIVASLSWYFRAKDSVLTDMIRFFEKYSPDQQGNHFY